MQSGQGNPQGGKGSAGQQGGQSGQQSGQAGQGAGQGNRTSQGGTGRQVDDNQDDMGRDINRSDKPSSNNS
jgi:hypothetical protein